MPNFEVDTYDNSEIIVAEKAYVDNSGTLRFYNTRDSDAEAQYASGSWKSYKKIACPHVRKACGLEQADSLRCP